MTPSAPDQAALATGAWWRTPRLAGRFAFHPLTFVAVVAPLSVGSIVLDGFSSGAPVGDALLAVLAGATASALVFFLLGAVVNVVVPLSSFSRTIAVLSVFAATEVLRTSTVALVLQARFPVEEFWEHRFLSGGLTGMALLGIASIVVNDREDYRRAYWGLSQRQAELQSALVVLERTVVEFLDDLRRMVRHTVDRALQPVIDSAQSGATADSVVGAIIEVSESVVRPLSHELQRVTQPDGPNELSTGRVPLPSLRRVIRLMSVTEPFRPGAIAALLVLVFLSASVLLFPFPQGFVFLLVVVVLASAAHLVGRRALFHRLLSWPGPARAAVITVIYLVPLALPLLAAIVLRGGGMSEARWATLFYLLMIVGILSWSLALVPALRRAREEALSDLEATTHTLAETRARVAIRVRRERTRLASVLHGDIQGRLMATALQLSQDPKSQGAHEHLEGLRAQLLHQLDQSGSALSVGFLHEIEESITQSWDGLVQITWVIDPETYPAVDLHPDTREAIDQVVREAITNAVKHGQSQRVTVTLSLDEDRLVLLRITDEGRGLTHAPNAGSGVRLYEAVTRDYALTDTGHGTRLEARIPLSLWPQGVAVA